MMSHIAYKEQPSVKYIANEFLAESFAYNKLTDTYTCPAGAILTSLGTIRKVKPMKPITVLKPTATMAVKHAA